MIGVRSGGGIWRKPARKMIIGDPKVQTCSKMIVHSAVLGSAIQLVAALTPNQPNMSLKSPCPPKTSRHKTAIATLDPSTALWTIILLHVWTFGSPMIIFLAGLRQIPREYY